MDFLIPISTWLRQQELFEALHTKPEVHYKDFGVGNERVYTEMWTGKWWQSMYDNLPVDAEGNKPIPLVILPESDKTHLNKSGKLEFVVVLNLLYLGNHFAHRLVITLANWTEDVRNSTRARQDVAFLPDFSKKDIPVKSHRPLCRVHLFHLCWQALLIYWPNFKNGILIYQLNSQIKRYLDTNSFWREVCNSNSWTIWWRSSGTL
jgi:hypothetical protein